MTDSRDAAIIKAEYADYRRVKGRKVMQIICEVSLEEAAAVHRKLGEPGSHDKQIWVAIALLNDNPEPPARKKREPEGPFNELPLVKQAGILCADPEFQRFMGHSTEENAAIAVRIHCRVDSRTKLDQFDDARIRWEALVDQYQDWQHTDARYKGTPAYEKARTE